MKMRLILSAAVLGTLILGSCGTSNDVVGGGIFQKRKYNKGFYWNRNANTKDSETVKFEEVKGSDVEYAMEQESASSAITVQDAYASVETSQDVASVNEGEVAVTMNDAAVVSVKNSAASEVANSETSTGKFSVFKAKKEAVKFVKKNSSSPASDVATILLVILAILIPPLAVLLFEGITSRFWIDLILAILGWGAYGILGGIFWLCGLIAIIYALLIVLNVI
jgi:uncharacterized membrane protein YqaE (UPF0057 family)